MENIPDPPVRQRSQLRSDVLLVNKQVDQKEFLVDITPYCLLASSSTLRVAFFGLLKDYVQPLDSFDLERLALINYKISILHLQKRLWTVYLHSGTGILSKTYPSRNKADSILYYWPTYLHDFPVARGYRHHLERLGSIDPVATHQTSVEQYLTSLDQTIQVLSDELQTIKREMIYYRDGLDEQVDRYVHKEVLPGVTLYYEMMMTLLKHDFLDRYLQQQYFDERPNENQVIDHSHRLFSMYPIRTTVIRLTFLWMIRFKYFNVFVN